MTPKMEQKVVRKKARNPAAALNSTLEKRPNLPTGTPKTVESALGAGGTEAGCVLAINSILLRGQSAFYASGLVLS
jgi:hypothetical protein